MKKPPNVLKLFSLILALLFLLNSCASIEKINAFMESLTPRTDWYNPSLKNLSAYQARQIKQIHITQCNREAEIKARQMYEMRYCSKEIIYQGQVIPATICDPPNENLANIQYATDYRNFFKECMVRNGFFEVKVDSKCYKTCRNNGGSSDDCSERCIITDNK
jgi:hypothetical protein